MFCKFCRHQRVGKQAGLTVVYKFLVASDS